MDYKETMNRTSNAQIKRRLVEILEDFVPFYTTTNHSRILISRILFIFTTAKTKLYIYIYIYIYNANR
jgi:hypothetical protein